VVRCAVQVCVAFQETASWKRALAIIRQDAFLARMSVLSPASLDPTAWGILCKLMDASVAREAAECSIPGIRRLARLMVALCMEYSRLLDDLVAFQVSCT
jgi:hypothetical protein